MYDITYLRRNRSALRTVVVLGGEGGNTFDVQSPKFDVRKERGRA